MLGPWYITVAVAREWQRLFPDDFPPGEAGLADATSDLAEIAASARYVKDEPDREVWRAKIEVDGRMCRCDLYVLPAARDDGNRPQLVRVRVDFGAANQRRRQRKLAARREKKEST